MLVRLQSSHCLLYTSQLQEQSVSQLVCHTSGSDLEVKGRERNVNAILFLFPTVEELRMF
jgi:hypothetical protein